MKLPGEPGFRGLSEKERQEELHDEYEDLIAKKLCDACNPEPCKGKDCPEVTSDGCPCFRAMPFDLWAKERNER